MGPGPGVPPPRSAKYSASASSRSGSDSARDQPFVRTGPRRLLGLLQLELAAAPSGPAAALRCLGRWAEGRGGITGLAPGRLYEGSGPDAALGFGASGSSARTACRRRAGRSSRALAATRHGDRLRKVVVVRRRQRHAGALHRDRLRQVVAVRRQRHAGPLHRDGRGQAVALRPSRPSAACRRRPGSRAPPDGRRPTRAQAASPGSRRSRPRSTGLLPRWPGIVGSGTDPVGTSSSPSPPNQEPRQYSRSCTNVGRGLVALVGLLGQHLAEHLVPLLRARGRSSPGWRARSGRRGRACRGSR